MARVILCEKIRQKVLHALAFLAVRHIILVDFLKIIVDLAGDSQLFQFLQKARALQS